MLRSLVGSEMCIRDRCSFIQNLAKFTSLTAYEQGTPGWQVWRNVENSMSDGRKIFRFLKYIPEAVKSYSALCRAAETGISYPAGLRALIEGCARAVSCLYLWLDNILWAQGVGMVSVVDLKQLKHRKNWSSFIRLLITLAGELVYFFTLSLSLRLTELGGRHIDLEIAKLDVLEHLLLLVSTLCNIRMTLPRIFKQQGFGCSQRAIGLVGMASSAAVIGTMLIKVKKSEHTKRNATQIRKAKCC
eukprot:TRINITY_DN5146_c0_g1_i1.p1 TRINITY_DN5146_c0_g1~~TRINITY_DN5146_c0_g1_i1.p1  ORF type:complete len:245 (-),score=77.85 TRINITY_DN5146_c0_g1_i1:335-1069(-)